MESLKAKIIIEPEGSITLTLAENHLEESVSEFPYYIANNLNVIGVESSEKNQEVLWMGY